MFLWIAIDTDPAHINKQADYRTHILNGWCMVRNVRRSTIQAAIRQRTDYPGTFCQRQLDGSISMGYGTGAMGIDNEFLRITLKTDVSLLIERDVYCTLPLYYGYDGDRFVVSNDYAEVVGALKNLTLNKDALCEYLLHLTPLVPHTLYKEIGILGERQVLYFKDGNIVHVPTTPRNWTYNSELARTNARAFPDMLSERFDYFVQTRLQGNSVGYELSGGLDSAFLPLYMAAKATYARAPASTVIQIDPTDRARQLHKIDVIESQTFLHSKRIFLDPQTHYPLARALRTHTFRPFNLTHELYEAPAVEVADYFQQQGVKVVVTGSGGDQLLEHRPHPSQLRQQQAQSYILAPFLTKACGLMSKRLGERTYIAHIPTLLSNSIAQETPIIAQRYIERDIWPVSPFHDVRLFNFCQGLPIQYRANKNVYRAYFEASAFPEQLYRGLNEDFGNFFNACFLSGRYNTIINRLAVTQKLAYVDVNKLTLLYADALQGKIDTSILFDVYTWMVAELNLQAISHWSSE
jgi:hypothetical protein